MASLDATTGSSRASGRAGLGSDINGGHLRSGQDLPDAALDHYLKRLDPEVAASFDARQRDALKTLLVGRGVARHLVEMRRSIPIGNKRYYFVFLFGQERRALRRLYSQGMATMGFNLFGYLLTAVGCILPLALVIALLI